MRLHIKQRVFSWNDRFTVKDDNGEDRFYVEGEVFTLGKKLHVYDTLGNEVCYIEQKLLSFRPRYYIHVGGAVYEMVKDFTLFYSSYRLEGLPWKLEGDFLSHEYRLDDGGGRTLLAVSKEWFTWGDSYALDIADPQSMLLCLAMVLVVDCVMASANNNG